MENAAEQLKELSPLNEVRDSSRFVVVVGEINRYEKGFQERYTRGEQNTLKFALMNVLQELSRNTGVQCWTEWISVDRIAILFVFKEQNDNNMDMSGQILVVAENANLG